ncbi:hypothetical protein [Jannaschia ovalis]|uniref:Uncharacterized protein n=1 Tax=Jannaschia ovalis TaxID=3038773 RepID=A0ABY8LEY0_9RHOB|nr:hypothetical protein [Jannaschia sp. GRR-S6-38]WGH79853.1 hypothetical protein P8627_06215 [Jannaschia sp. GRR-S6-38]
MLFNAVILSMAMLAAILAIGGGLMVLARQQVVVDEKGHVSQIEIPFFGKLSTNYPSLVAIIAGIALAYATMSRLVIEPQIPTLPLSAQVTFEGLAENTPVFVNAVPQRYLRTATVVGTGETPHEMILEVDEPGPYTVIAYTVTGVSPDGRPIFTLTQGPARRGDGRFEFSGRLIKALQEAVEEDQP